MSYSSRPHLAFSKPYFCLVIDDKRRVDLGLFQTRTAAEKALAEWHLFCEEPPAMSSVEKVWISTRVR